MRLLDRIDALLQKDFVNPSTWYGAACYYAILFILAAIVLAAILPRIVRRVLVADQRGLFDRTAVTFLTELGQIVVYILVLLAYLHLIPGLRGIGTAMLTSVSVISLVVGFAAQNALSNVIAGIALVLYRPFQIGDWIQVNAPVGVETGIVDSLALEYTAIRTTDNRHIVIPNSQMASQTTINLTQTAQKSLVSIPVEMPSGLDLDEIGEKLLSGAGGCPAFS
jgi:small-conductance mechanosensitive channel